MTLPVVRVLGAGPHLRRALPLRLWVLLEEFRIGRPFGVTSERRICAQDKHKQACPVRQDASSSGPPVPKLSL